MRLDRLALPALMATVLGLTACGQSGSGAGAGSTGAAPSVIQVTATDTACTLSATTAPAGTITFRVTNSGSKVNEFYVYGPGDRVVAEVENITP
ncbi:MAG: cupredoxin domain-containing protein, partial [Actinomycetota bacterium]|nr:cupredoxin domain-containing protein [Actinomycetota bacterium]